MEARHGVSGYRNTQDAIESVSTMKSEFDSMKGRTLEDMSDMVQQFNSKIASKKAALEPIIRELRSVRQQAQVVTMTFCQTHMSDYYFVTESEVLYIFICQLCVSVLCKKNSITAALLRQPRSCLERA